MTLAEQSLKAEESKPGFSLALLQIVAADPHTFPHQTRLASALFFKNFVRRNWVVCVGKCAREGQMHGYG